MSVKALVFVGLVMAGGSITSGLNSPCPDLFHYDSTDQPGQWTGTVTLLSDAELHGVWIRLIFDGKLNKLEVGEDFGDVVSSDDREQFLIKNRNVLLKPGTPTNVKITVKYEGNKVPNLIGYRLNAREVCSTENVNSRDHFAGDLDNKDFLTWRLSSNKSSDYSEFVGCGTVPLQQDKELKDGTSQNGSWPWQAAIYIQKNNEEKYTCEATLISSKHIITSAHCVTYKNSELVIPAHQLTVYLGKYHQDENNVQKLKVERILLYPGYQSSSLLNDIAIILLDKPVIINEFTRPICLRKSSDKEEGYLVGYGIKQDHKIGDLTQAKVKIISGEECSKHSDLKSLLTDNVFCASYLQGNSLCVGDSGSSLALLREGSRAVWELKGIVSVGVALQDAYLCDPSSTVFLVEVANYLKWIQAVTS